MRLFIGILFVIAACYVLEDYFDKQTLFYKKLGDFKKLEKHGVKISATVSPPNYFFEINGFDYSGKYTGISPFASYENTTMLVDIYYLPENPAINSENPADEVALIENEISFNRFLYLGILVFLFIAAVIDYYRRLKKRQQEDMV